MDLENKVALVTGAASEIGRAYVKYLFLNKVKVLLCDLQVEKCQLIANEFLKEFGNINAHTMKCDVTNRNEFENVFKTCIKVFGRLDIVINNAGVFDNSIDRWPIIVNVNYGGIVNGTLLAIKYMGIPSGGNGGIVVQTTASMVFRDNTLCTSMYKSTKTCVMDFTKIFVSKWKFGYHGVKVITLCPGFTGTDFVGAINQINKTINGNNEHEENIDDVIKSLTIQEPNHVGNALIEILKHGNTGETWIVENSKPSRLVE